MKSRSNAKLAIVATTAQMVHVERWEWRQLIGSQYGPASPITRHLLHTLALHMDPAGGNCWPSQLVIAKRAALCPRAVKYHIAIARRTFWLRVTETHVAGQAWRRNSYVATIPAALHPLVLALKKGEITPLWTSPERGAPGAPTWGTTCPDVGHHVPPNLTSNLLNESVLRGAAVDKSSKHRSKPAAGDRSKDDLKSRSGGRAERSAALRARITDATKLVRTSAAPRHDALTDAELATKVKKLRAIGQGDGDIRRALASQASAAQLTRVLKSNFSR